MKSLNDIAKFLNCFFTVDRFPVEERGGIYQPSLRSIARLGLAIEPWKELSCWVISSKLDAIFLHRPWKLEPGQLTNDIGILNYHLPFDERLTLGFNIRLAEVIGMEKLEMLGEKQGRSIGMIGEIPTRDFTFYCACVEEIFGGIESFIPGNISEVGRVAVVGAMTDALVREATLRGADIYITGQIRQPARVALQETGIGVIEVGHLRCEKWGLQALAGVLRERFWNLEIVLQSLE